MALRETLEQVMRVATYRPVKIWSPVGLLLQIGKVLLGLFGHRLERVLQEEVEVGAQETEYGRTHQLDRSIDLAVALNRPGKTGQDNHGAEPFGPTRDHPQSNRPRDVVTEDGHVRH